MKLEVAQILTLRFTLMIEAIITPWFHDYISGKHRTAEIDHKPHSKCSLRKKKR